MPVAFKGSRFNCLGRSRFKGSMFNACGVQSSKVQLVGAFKVRGLKHLNYLRIKSIPLGNNRKPN